MHARPGASVMIIINQICAAFDLAPVSQEVAIRTEAVFRCQHSTAFIVLWRVNGSLVGRNPLPDITPGTTRDDIGNLVDTLSITARPNYNRTEVVCVARFDDGSPDEQTHPAALIGTTSHIIG